MAQPYVGEIRMFAGNFEPAGWMFCSGQLLPISQYETLFNLIGTTYGGDGQSTFALPNLQSRFPIHMGTLPGGNNYTLAQTGGTETITLLSSQVPGHFHAFGVPAFSGLGNSEIPVGNVRARIAEGEGAYKGYQTTGGSPGPTILHLASPSNTDFMGGSQPHENMPPFLAVDFIISLFGIFPSQT